MKIKMADIAELSGVSVSTVSRALRNESDRPVSPETASRIFEAAEKLGYLSSFPYASGFKSKNSDPPGTLVCILTSHFDTYDDYFFMQMLAGINAEAERLNYRVTHNYAASDYGSEHVLSQLSAGKFDGVILLGRYDKKTLNELVSLSDNMVYSGLNRLNIGIDEVICDAYGAISSLTAHLINTGCRNIGYIGAIPEKRSGIVNEHRFKAFCDAMTLGGMRVNDTLCIDIEPGMDSGYLAALNMIHGKAPIDAIVCANDTTALGVIRALNEEGIKIPDEISVVGMGFDNSEMGEYMTPKLTTADMQLKEIGRFAVKVLVDRIEGYHNIPVTTLLPYKLVIRGSSRDAPV